MGKGVLDLAGLGWVRSESPPESRGVHGFLSQSLWGEAACSAWGMESSETQDLPRSGASPPGPHSASPAAASVSSSAKWGQ